MRYNNVRPSFIYATIAQCNGIDCSKEENYFEHYTTVVYRHDGYVFNFEGFLEENETPDGRYGAVVQYWLGGDDVEKFAFELSYRLRQDVLVKPFTRIFDYSDSEGDEFIEMMDIVGHCGDGYEWIV